MSIMVLLLGNLCNSASQLTSRNKQGKVHGHSQTFGLPDSRNFVLQQYKPTSEYVLEERSIIHS